MICSNNLILPNAGVFFHRWHHNEISDRKCLDLIIENNQKLLLAAAHGSGNASYM